MTWWEMALRMLLAAAVGCIIGAEREHKHRPAGLRTHILVCVGASLVSVMECLNMEAVAAAQPGVSVSLGRMSAQVISGIGFLGAGTIFMAQKRITGLTTAASLWCTGCLGLAAGMGHYALLAAGGVVVMVTLTVLRHLVHGNEVRRLQVTYTNRAQTQAYINAYFAESGVKVLDVDFHVVSDGDEMRCTNLYTLDLLPARPGAARRRASYPDIVMHLSEYEHVQSVRTINE